jgi:hypothetical protein
MKTISALFVGFRPYLAFRLKNREQGVEQRRQAKENCRRNPQVFFRHERQCIPVILQSEASSFWDCVGQVPVNAIIGKVARHSP